MDTNGIDIIMPVYNKEEFLTEAINSLLNQSFNDFRLIIIDDGSTDNSLEVIKKFGDSRIVLLLHEKNKGVAKAMNTGLDNSRAKYIIRVDADDISVPDRLKCQWEFMEANPEIDFSSGKIEFFGNREFIQDCFLDPKEINSLVLFQTTVYQGAAVWRRSFIENHKLRFNEYIGNVGEDWEFWVRCSALGRGGNIDKVLIRYRQHDNNVSGENELYYQKRKAAVQEIFRFKSWPEKYIQSHFIFRKVFPNGINKMEWLMFLEWCDYLENWIKDKKEYSSEIIHDYILNVKKQIFYIIADHSIWQALQFKRKAKLQIKGYWLYLAKILLKGNKPIK